MRDVRLSAVVQHLPADTAGMKLAGAARPGKQHRNDFLLLSWMAVSMTWNQSNGGSSCSVQYESAC